MRIAVRLAGGTCCELSPRDHWTCHDLNVEIQQRLGFPVSQQRLIHGCDLLEEFMSAAAIGTMGQLLEREAGPEMSLDLLLYIRSPEAAAALDAVRQDGMRLQDVSAELKGDREVVKEAVRQDGKALQHASQELQADRSVVTEAVRQSAWVLQHASEELRDDRRVVTEAVRQSGWALQFASEGLKGDRDLVTEAVQQHGLVLQFASEELQGDREVVMEAVRQDGKALQHASEELKGNRDVDRGHQAELLGAPICIGGAEGRQGSCDAGCQGV